MELSKNIWNVLEEVKAIQKAEPDDKRVAALAPQLLRMCQALESRLEALSIYSREQKGNIERFESDIRESEKEKEASKKAMELICTKINELKASEKALQDKFNERKGQIDEKCSKLISEMSLDTLKEKVERMAKENEALKEEIKAKVDEFSSRESEFDDQIKQINLSMKDQSVQMNKRLQEVQKHITILQEKQRVKAEKITKAAELRRSIGTMYEQSPEYVVFFQKKHKQYLEYKKNIFALIEKLRREHLKKQEYEEYLGKLNKDYLELFNENDLLTKKLEQEQQKTTASMKECKELQAKLAQLKQ